MSKFTIETMKREIGGKYKEAKKQKVSRHEACEQGGRGYLKRKPRHKQLES